MSRKSALERARGALRWRVLRNARPKGALGVATVGHREYIGGMWDEMGQLQFDYVVRQGLEPQHVLLDIACGSLRGGVRFISYLDAGNYLGLEKERALVRRGVEKELDPGVRAAKQPEFVISGRFEFQRFSKQPDMSLAQSLFSHLNEADILLCLRQLALIAPAHHRFFATYFDGRNTVNKRRSNSHQTFRYEASKLADIAAQAGWDAENIGDWGHPRGQQMICFTPARQAISVSP